MFSVYLQRFHEKRTYRYFSAADKKRIFAEADACAHGELGELLRREKIYSTQLSSIGNVGRRGFEERHGGTQTIKRQ